VTDSAPTVIARSRSWPILAICVALVVVGIALGLAYGTWTSPALAIVVAGWQGRAAVRTRNHAVLADDKGILVRDKDGTDRWADWSEIDRAGWVAPTMMTDFAYVGGLRLHYRRDMRGDTRAPETVGEISTIIPADRRRAARTVQELLTQHRIDVIP
jgi:hypothetical protein